MSHNGVWLLALCILGLIAWGGWPVSVWLIVSLAVTHTLALLRNHATEAKMHSPHIGRAIIEAVLTELRTGAVWISVGLGCVTAAQCGLSLFPAVASVETVRKTEMLLLVFRDSVKQGTGVGYSLPLFLGLGLLLFLTNHVAVAERTLWLRRWASRLGVVLVVSTSFTFFSYTAVTVAEPVWRAAYVEEAHRILDDVMPMQRETVAASMLHDTVQSLSQMEQQDIQAFFRQIGTHGQGRQILIRTVENASKRAFPGKSTINMPPDTVDVASLSPEDRGWGETLGKLSRNLDSNVPLDANISSPQLNEFLHHEEILQQRIKLGRKVAIEAATAVISQLVPGENGGLAKLFAETMVKSLAKGSLEEILPRSVIDFESAQRFRNMLRRTGFGASGMALDLRGDNSGASSEEAISKVITREAENIKVAEASNLLRLQSLREQTMKYHHVTESHKWKPKPRPGR